MTEQEAKDAMERAGVRHVEWMLSEEERLRDMFAACIVGGLAAHPHPSVTTQEEFAIAAYQLADKMLAVRKTGYGPTEQGRETLRRLDTRSGEDV